MSSYETIVKPQLNFNLDLYDRKCDLQSYKAHHKDKYKLMLVKPHSLLLFLDQGYNLGSFIAL